MQQPDETDWAKVLGELIADHELRMTENVKRAAVLPPELADELAKAIRLLHESPPLANK